MGVRLSALQTIGSAAKPKARRENTVSLGYLLSIRPLNKVNSRS